MRHTLEAEILAAGKPLGLRIPQALADFYRVAWKADDYNRVFERLLPPNEWSIESGKPPFMKESQSNVLQGTDDSVQSSEGPRASGDERQDTGMGARQRALLRVPPVDTHLAATLGGATPCASTAAVDERLRETLDRDWSFVG